MSKKYEQGKNVYEVHNDNSLPNVLALAQHQRCGLRHHGNKLNQLHHCERRFPPDRQRFPGLWIFRVHADEVICVHDRVDEPIEYNGQENIAVVVGVGIQPVKQENRCVMVHVQERQLAPFLAQNNKDRVPEVPYFRGVEQPKKIGDRCIVVVVNITAAKNSVPVSVRQHQCLDGHVRTQHNLRDVVNKFNRIRIDGRHVVHHFGSDKHKREIRERNIERRWEIR